MKRVTLTAIAASVAIGCLPTFAQVVSTTPDVAHLLDGSGKVVHNASGECWRTGQWTPALASAPCEAMPTVPTVIAAAPTPKPAEAIKEPTPVPQPAPVVMAPMLKKVTFSADALFAFDKSVLSPASHALLDDLVVQLSDTTSDVITITGNTDRIGTPEYNQNLSERRAIAVRDYLVSKSIQTSSIEVKGVGSTQPVTLAEDCKGTKATAKLIACLQPDRRVDVEMTGTKLRAPIQ